MGVALKDITVDDRLAPGGSYELPALGVVNTGDVTGVYEVSIGYPTDQAEQRPSEGWFRFEPKRFELVAGTGQQVAIRLDLPTNARPGDYLAYLEAHPVLEDGSIGIAAATRVSFTVKPSSWLDAQLLNIETWLRDHEPWTYAVPLAVLLALGLYALLRRFRFSFAVQRRR